MSEPNDVFQKRATYTDKRVADFAAKLKERIEPSDRVVGEHTCIYTTGSAGRGELGEHSDLDIFLLSTREQASKLDAVVLQSAIVRALDASHFPPPSNDGEFLTLHTVERLVEHMGGRDDDWSNTFTARMLLLLESRPLVGEASYEQAIDAVLAAYWKNFDRHPHDYLPFLLVNDIVRYWRIVLLNYESKNTQSKGKPEGDRWLRSYKLRFSRCLMCYSALAYLLLLSAGSPGHVEREDVRRMVKVTPIRRLHAIADRSEDAVVRGQIEHLLDLYASFLETTDAPKQVLIDQFSIEAFRRERFEQATKFGDAVFELMRRLGGRSALYRYVVV